MQYSPKGDTDAGTLHLLPATLVTSLCELHWSVAMKDLRVDKLLIGALIDEIHRGSLLYLTEFQWRFDR